MICWYRCRVCCLLCGCILKNHFDHQVRAEVVLVLLVVKLWRLVFIILFFFSHHCLRLGQKRNMFRTLLNVTISVCDLKLINRPSACWLISVRYLFGFQFDVLGQ